MRGSEHTSTRLSSTLTVSLLSWSGRTFLIQRLLRRVEIGMFKGFLEINPFNWVIFQHPSNQIKELLRLLIIPLHISLETGKTDSHNSTYYFSTLKNYLYLHKEVYTFPSHNDQQWCWDPSLACRGRNSLSCKHATLVLSKAAALAVYDSAL